MRFISIIDKTICLFVPSVNQACNCFLQKAIFHRFSPIWAFNWSPLKWFVQQKIIIHIHELIDKTLLRKTITHFSKIGPRGRNIPTPGQSISKLGQSITNPVVLSPSILIYFDMFFEPQHNVFMLTVNLHLSIKGLDEINFLLNLHFIFYFFIF